VTDVCLKRKIRNYIELVKEDAEGYEIYVKEGAVLNAQHRRAYEALNIKPEKKKLPKDQEKAMELTRFMCQHFYDIRTFGAVMTTEVNCGQVRGPVQLNFARSIDPIVQQEITITRLAVTSEKDAERKDREMGRKHIIPYALYRVEGYVSAPLAQKTGFSTADLDLFWEALINMFDHDRSAARGKMASHKLFDCIEAVRKEKGKPPRAFMDYEIVANEEAIPAGVELIEML
jgi:CRISPR-associated protein Csd2